MLIYGFNDAFKNKHASYLRVGDDTMSAIHFQTIVNENLPHLSYIFRNPESMGMEFKTAAYSVTEEFLSVEI